MIKKLSMMTLEEAIKHCEEKACGNTECAAEHKQLAEWLKELQAMKSLPSDLDEAAEKNFETMEVLEHENIFEETHNKIFKAGAEWLAGQGVSFKDEVIFCGSTPFLKDADFDILEARESFKDGDTVIVQIRKKQ